MDCTCKTCTDICKLCNHSALIHGKEGCLYADCICGDSKRSVGRIFKPRPEAFKNWYERNKVEYNKKRNARKAESKSRTH